MRQHALLVTKVADPVSIHCPSAIPSVLVYPRTRDQSHYCAPATTRALQCTTRLRSRFDALYDGSPGVRLGRLNEGEVLWLFGHGAILQPGSLEGIGVPLSQFL